MPRSVPRQRHRLAQRRYVATFTSSAHLGTLARAAAQSLDNDQGRPVVVVADRAQWIKTKQARHFPEATCILDWAHLWREVAHAVRVAAREKALSRQERTYQLYLLRSWLWQGAVKQALQALQTLARRLATEPREQR